MDESVELKYYLKKQRFGLAIALIGILLLGSVLVSMNAKSDPVVITVQPEVPKEGTPILVTFYLNNPSILQNRVSYEFYANGQLLLSGSTIIPPASNKKFVYLYPEAPALGERVTFIVKTDSDQGDFEKVISMPAYPPQVWSSFVSFASFSTSLMGTSSMGASMGSSMGSSLTSVTYYDRTFVNSTGLNVGLTFSMVLIILLVFLELTEPIEGKGFKILGLRIRFSKLSAVLFTVFMGMVFTKVVMIIG
jgi:hypothetical protein